MTPGCVTLSLPFCNTFLIKVAFCLARHPPMTAEIFGGNGVLYVPQIKCRGGCEGRKKIRP